MPGKSPRDLSAREIPYPHLKSWMHERIPLPHETRVEKIQRYLAQPEDKLWAQSIISRLMERLKPIRHPRLKWALYRMIFSVLHRIYRLIHRLEIRGKENIPPEGAIFIINHLPGPDVVAPFLTAFKQPVSPFCDAGNGYLADFLEVVFNFVIRRGRPAVMVEKMIRTIAQKNRYFAMWPEGTLERYYKVIEGFSGIVKVYATLNAGKNRIPFVPVIFQRWTAGNIPRMGLSEEEVQVKLKRIHERVVKARNKKFRKFIPKKYYKSWRFSKMRFTFLKPRFVPQEWLNPPEEGGKTPREIINWVMLIIARAFGQEELAPNQAVERRRKHPGQEWH